MLHTPLFRRKDLWSIGDHSPHAPFPQAITSVLQDPGASIRAQHAALRQLEEFVHTLFTFKMPENFFWQIGAVAVFLLVVFVLGTGIVMHRIFTRRFWLFKLMRKSDGSYVVPNAFNSFLLFEGIFGATWVAFSVVIYLAYERRVDHLQYHILALSGSAWIPLILGATFCGWGSFYTAPGALDGNLRKRLRGWTGFKPKTAIINFISLVSPILLIISVLTPALIAQRGLSHSFDEYLSWRSEVLPAASSNTLLSADVAQQYLSAASDIWDQQANASGILAVTYLIWSGWAGLFIIFYLVAAGWLVLVIYKQLRRQHGLVKSLLEEEEQDRQTRLQEHAQLAVGEASLSPTRVQPSRRASSPHDLPPLQGDSILFSPLGTATELPPTQSEPAKLEAQKTQAQDSAVRDEVFFPKLKEDAKKRATRRISSFSGPVARFRYLRRCFVSLTLLYVGVVLGALLYFIITCRLGANLYDAALAGPDSMTDLVYSSHLLAAWGAVVFGAVTFGAIFVRDLDPASSPRSAELSPTGAALALPPRAGKFGLSSPFKASAKRQLQSSGAFGSSAQMATTAVDSTSSQFYRTSDARLDRASSSSAQSRRITPPLQSPAHAKTSTDSSARLPGALKLKHKISNIREARRRSATVSEIEGLDANVTGITSMPEMYESHRQQSGQRNKTVYYPTPFGPMPAPARLDERPLAPEAYPPPLAASSQDDLPPFEIGEGHGDVDLDEIFGDTRLKTVGNGLGLSPAVKRMHRRSDLSLGTLSAASPTSEGSGSYMGEVDEPRSRAPRNKTSDWVLQELVRMDRERSAFGVAPLGKPARRRPSHISLTIDTPSMSSTSRRDSYDYDSSTPFQSRQRHADVLQLELDRASAELDGLAIARRRSSQPQLRTPRAESNTILFPSSHDTATADTVLRRGFSSPRLGEGFPSSPTSPTGAPTASSPFALRHEYAFTAPYIQSSRFDDEDDPYDNTPGTPLSPRPIGKARAKALGVAPPEPEPEAEGHISPSRRSSDEMVRGPSNTSGS